MINKQNLSSFRFGSLTFVPLAEKHLLLTLKWRNRKRIRCQFVTTRKLNEQEHREWFAGYADKAGDFVFVIHKDDEPIGQVSVYDVDWERKSATFGRLMIGEAKAIRRGYGTVATLAMIHFAFMRLGLSRLSLQVRENNSVAISIYESCGFKWGDADGELLEMEMANTLSQWDRAHVGEFVEHAWQTDGERTYFEQGPKKATLKLLREGDDLLDVGCGTGRLADVGAEVNQLTYTGLDTSSKMLAATKSKYPGAKVRFGNVLALPFESDSFDVVACFGVLQYLPPILFERATQELFRVARRAVVFSQTLSKQAAKVSEVVDGVSFERIVRTESGTIFALNQAYGGNRLDFIAGDQRNAIFACAKVDRPTHSVIVGSYNRPNMITRALQSVVDQTIQDYEVIITDDGSNAKTIEAIQGFIKGDDRFRLLCHIGPADGEPRPNCALRAVNRINDAIPYVRGRLVHYLPDDDWYESTRFESFEELFSDPKVKIGYGRLIWVDKNGNPIGREQYPGKPIVNPLSQMGQAQMVHRSELFETVRQWPTEGIDYASDGFFFLSLVKNGFGPIYGIDHVVSYNRAHPYNMLNTQHKTTSKREEALVEMSAGPSAVTIKAQKVRSRAICVLGMHRSGTSAITRALNLLGAYLGPPEQFSSGNRRNPLGFWERFDLVSLNDLLLRSLKREWNDDRPIVLHNVSKNAREELYAFVKAEFGTWPFWAWKDPRNCLLLPCWRSALDYHEIDVEYVIVLRSPLACARSMDGLKDVECDLDRGLRMWANYTLSALANLGPERRTMVRYDGFVNDPLDAALRFAQRLELPKPTKDVLDEIGSWIRPDMRHYGCPSRGELERAFGRKKALAAIVRETYDLCLHAMADDALLNSDRFRESAAVLLIRYEDWVKRYYRRGGPAGR